ncbi:MAG: monovalent cation/H(+) antiporter subunit G [Anaerolineae bacterium]|nr:monovalent cation/H(+) antiporter subunit G [Anaerolineae bacterium]
MDTLIVVLFMAGLFFNLTAVVGMIRMPDLYCRLHSSSKNTTLGSLLIVVGLALREFQAGEGPAGIKMLVIASFLLIVTPIGSHALARAAYRYGTPLWEGTVCDQYADAPQNIE